MTACDHCGKPERFNVLCADCEQLACETCGRVECCCMTPRERFMREMHEGAEDQWLAEYAVRQCWSELAQPESLDRFVRAARLQPDLWGAAATNAVYQLANITLRTRRL